MSSAQIDAELSASVPNGAAHDPLAAAVVLIDDIAAAADEIEENDGFRRSFSANCMKRVSAACFYRAASAATRSIQAATCV